MLRRPGRDLLRIGSYFSPTDRPTGRPLQCGENKRAKLSWILLQKRTQFALICPDSTEVLTRGCVSRAKIYRAGFTWPCTECLRLSGRAASLFPGAIRAGSGAVQFL